VIEEQSYATRAFPQAQTLLRGAVERTLPTYVSVGWFDSDVDSYAASGSFALVAKEYEDLLGDVLALQHGNFVVYVYVYGVADLPEKISVARRAFMGLDLLAAEAVPCTVGVLQ
jgi:hypothetical protein